MSVKEPRIELARLPTPIQRLERLSARHGVDLRVKRDDLTGLAVSGNKVRKLEYLVADARSQGADTLVTCGAVGSNHCRATAAVAARLGLSSALILRTEDGQPPPAPWSGNLLLCRLLGAEIRFVSRQRYREYDGNFDETAATLRARGRRPYVIPEGGSNALGSRGYARAYAELLGQWPEADVVVAAMGSGGTAAGLVMGRREAGGGPRPVAINVCDDEAFFRTRVQSIVGDRAEDDLQILDGFKGRGYALSTPAELAFIADVAATEGLLLDPVYTGKAFLGMLESLRTGRLRARRLLFVHTGGAFGLFSPEAALGLSEAYAEQVYAKSVKR